MFLLWRDPDNQAMMYQCLSGCSNADFPLIDMLVMWHWSVSSKDWDVGTFFLYMLINQHEALGTFLEVHRLHCITLGVTTCVLKSSTWMPIITTGKLVCAKMRKLSNGFLVDGNKLKNGLLHLKKNLTWAEQNVTRWWNSWRCTDSLVFIKEVWCPHGWL